MANMSLSRYPDGGAYIVIYGYLTGNHRRRCLVFNIVFPVCWLLLG
ncbi:hypothetical protein KCP74_02025 [Salmonella enterica subsp. enterica]|nr:hypothetical protein KCP74_02025 [Salmonella enterica subsp. enterica]